MVKVLLAICLFLLGPSLLAYGQIGISIDIDRKSFYADDQVELKVVVSGVQQSPRPQFNASKDFELGFGGVSSQVQIVNGRMNASAVFTYYLSPKRSGEITVGPAQVTVDGKTYKSTVLKVKVLDAGEKAPEETYYYVTAAVDEKNPFVNQQVIYTFRFFTRARVANAELKMPEFNGFWKEQLGKQKEFQKNINGLNWRVTEIRLALFPSASGKVTIEPASLGLAVVLQRRGRSGFSFFNDPFFSSGKTKKARIRTQPIEMNVRPLPPAPKGQKFSGLVGHFSVSSHLGKQVAKVGESTTLTVKVEGIGNIRDARFETNHIAGFKTYADKPTVKMGVRQGRMGGVKEFKIALVPQSEGLTELPPVNFLYFDPETQTYKSAGSQTIKLNVVGSGEEKLAHVSASQGRQAKQEVKLLGTDLMPIKTEISDMEPDIPTIQERWVLFSSMAVCPLFYLIAFGWRRRMDRISSDTGYLQREKAYRSFKNSYGSLSKSSSFYADASLLLRNYLGDKLSLDGKALTTSDISRKLAPNKISASTIEKLKSFMQTCESGQYGGASLDDKNKNQLTEDLSQLVKTIEKEVR